MPPASRSTTWRTARRSRDVRERVSSANAYYGAWPVVEALRERRADRGDGPLHRHRHHARADDPRLRAGRPTTGTGSRPASSPGHIVECGAQSTGGNFTDWRTRSALRAHRLPGARGERRRLVHRHQARRHRRSRDGAHGEGAAGLRDGRSARLHHARRGRRLRHRSGSSRPDAIACACGACAGRPAPASLKVSASYFDGWKASGTLIISAPDAADEGARVRGAVLGAARPLVRRDAHRADRTLRVLGTARAGQRIRRRCCCGCRCATPTSRRSKRSRRLVPGGDPVGPAGRRGDRRPPAGAGSGGVLAGAGAARSREAAPGHARRRAHARLADADRVRSARPRRSRGSRRPKLTDAPRRKCAHGARAALGAGARAQRRQGRHLQHRRDRARIPRSIRGSSARSPPPW